ncbi:fibronectin type III domain-containing protein [Leptothrix sp. BB-3]
MKRKLIVTLVASALELYAAAATAQVGSCDLVGTSKSANMASPVTAGPLNPVDGFPEYVTDSTGLSVQRCLDANWCFFDPIVDTDPFSIQIGSGGEAFYWGADALLADNTGKAVFRLVMAAETAFLQAGPNGEPINGSQFPFLRLRYVFDAPADGIYTLKHPYGTEEFEVVGATGNRDIFTTYDRGLNAGQITTGNVGPFMKSVFIPATGFLGDGGALAAPDLATGAPCHANADGFATVTLSGVTAGGAPIDFGGGQTVLSTDLFAIQGRVYDGRVQTPLNNRRLTYSRTAASGQVEAFASSTTPATVTVQNGPTVPGTVAGITAVTTLAHSNLTPDGATAAEGVNSRAVGVAALPPVVTITADDASLAAGVRQFDPTAEHIRLVDFVDIASADYDPNTHILTVQAASGDKVGNPVLAVRGLGNIDPATSTFRLTTVAPPAVVNVDSANGGTASTTVRVITSVPPAAPLNPTFDFATANTLTLHWTDNSDNESGFKVYTVDGAGVRTLRGQTGPGVAQLTISGLATSTSYTLQVDSFNSVGSASSTTIVASTIALPAQPASANFVFSTSVQRQLDIGWAAVAEATSYQVYKRIGTGAYALLATVPATQTSYTDGAGAASTAYTYQVVALRNINGITDSSVATTTTTQTSVGAPTSSAITGITVSGNTVTVNWNDRSSNETGFQLYRIPVVNGTAGTPVAIGGVITPTNVASTANPMSVQDTNVPGGNYRYRVDVRNWATTVSSNVSPAAGANPNTVAVIELKAVTNLTATINGSPTLAWTDNSINESGYRAARSLATVAADGTVTFAAATNLAQAANSTGFREANALTANRTYRYVVTPLNGATVGPAATVYTFTNALPTPNAPTFSLNNASGVTVTWSLGGGASTLSVGGYEVQRCIANAAGTACAAGQTAAKLNGTAVNTAGTVDGRATLTFRDTTAAAGTRYRYFVRAVGGAGVNNAAGNALVGPLGAGASVLKN